MKFDTASRLARTLVIASAVLCVIGLIMGANYAAARLLVTLAALVMLSISVIVVVVFCKCPHCGKRIFMGASRVIYCPNCRRNLETGKKVSRKKAKTTYKK